MALNCVYVCVCARFSDGAARQRRTYLGQHERHCVLGFGGKFQGTRRIIHELFPFDMHCCVRLGECHQYTWLLAKIPHVMQRIVVGGGFYVDHRLRSVSVLVRAITNGWRTSGIECGIQLCESMEK